MTTHRDIVVVGGSAGGLSALGEIISRLPTTFAAAMFVVLHREAVPDDIESLTDVIRTQAALPVHSAADQQRFQSGHVYVAPADYHLLLARGKLCLQQSPKEQQFRPCIDVLFKSAAQTYGRRVIGVVLSGAWGHDGAEGLRQIIERGGLGIVQDPKDAEFADMPRRALEQGDIEFVMPAREMAGTLTELTAPRTEGVEMA